MAATEETSDSETTAILPMQVDDIVNTAVGETTSIVDKNNSKLDGDDDDPPPLPELLVTLVAKFGKERVITLDNLDGNATTIGQVKQLLQFQTNILPKRQKLVGLVALQGGARGVHDDLLLSGLKVKNNNNNNNNNATTVIKHQFILMGTPEQDIFVDPSERDDLPDVLDDFGLEFNAGSDEWCVHPCIRANVIVLLFVSLN